MTNDINQRIALCKFVISVLEKVDDPRQPEALEHYRAQLAELEKQPHDVVIGLKTARLFSKAQGV